MEEKSFEEILSPPKERTVTAEMQPLTYYMFSSIPKPLPANPKIGDRRPRFLNNVPKPHGVHNFYNVMWDPRVRRGSTHVTETDRRAEDGARLRALMTAKMPPRSPLMWDGLSQERRKEIKAERHLPAQLRAKRHIALQMELANQLAEASRLRKRARAKRRKEREEKAEHEEMIRKQKQLAFKPIGGSKDFDDFDVHLFAAEKSDSGEEEELDENGQLKMAKSIRETTISQRDSSVDNVYDDSLRKLSLVSTDSDIELRDDEPSLVPLDMEDRPSDDSQDEEEVPRQPKWVFPPVPSLDPTAYTEMSSQTYPGDFFLFTENAMGAVGVLVADAVKDAIYELCIDEEQNTMEKNHEEFDRKRQEHLQRMAQLQYRTALVINERQRLEKSDILEESMKLEGQEMKKEAMFSSGAAGSVVHDAMRQLEEGGFFGDLYLHRVRQQFVPWLNSAVELFTRDSVIGNRLVDEIVDEVVTKRDEELVYAQYRQSRSTKSGSVYAEPKTQPSIDSLDETFFR